MSGYSVSDSFDSTNSVAISLAENSSSINIALSGNSKTLFICSELEEELIHYSHARRLGQQDEAPKSHKAKPTFKYIKALNGGEYSGFYECYSELCEYTHPAFSSANYMNDEESECLYNFSTNSDVKNIEYLANKYREMFLPLFTFAFNPAFLVLKVIRHFNINEIHCKSIDRICMDNVPAWRKCEKLLSSQ